MGALAPIFLVATLAIGVPIFLHLFQRHETRRVAFPALRYLERTEREHARRIRFRQLLLLLLRVGILLLVVGAGARLFFHGRGTAHPPTAVVMIIDNSMSSGLVVGESRVLDRAKALAHHTLDQAGDEDRFWILPAGEPWRPALPGSAKEVRPALDALEASDAFGDISAAVGRATELLETSPIADREIHILSDLQATGFSAPVRAGGQEIPIVVWTGAPVGPENHALTGLVVGAGLSPLAGQRSQVTVQALRGPEGAAPIPVRLILNERIRGAATVPPGAGVSITLPPVGGGWVEGYIESDPDALRADDRRFFAFRARPAPTVGVLGDPGEFVVQAISVLEEAGRMTRGAPGANALLVSGAGAGLDQLGTDGAALVVPPSDPTLLPALNRRLVAAGIPWRYATRLRDGESDLSGRRLPPPLTGVRVRTWYALALQGDPESPTGTLAEAAGDPWAVEGTAARGGRYLLLASALDPASSSLPVSSNMLQFVEWVASEWGGAGSGPVTYAAGDHLPAPRHATQVRLPSGVDNPVDGTRMIRGTGKAGFYRFLSGDSVLSVVAVNPASEESSPDRLDADGVSSALGDRVTLASDDTRWGRAIYRARQGPELWWLFVILALGLLLIEAIVAGAGRVELRGSRRSASRAEPTVDVAG